MDEKIRAAVLADADTASTEELEAVASKLAALYQGEIDRYREELAAAREMARERDNRLQAQAKTVSKLSSELRRYERRVDLSGPGFAPEVWIGISQERARQMVEEEDQNLFVAAPLLRGALRRDYEVTVSLDVTLHRTVEAVTEEEAIELSGARGDELAEVIESVFANTYFGEFALYDWAVDRVEAGES